jgi:hypothetical protein
VISIGEATEGDDMSERLAIFHELDRLSVGDGLFKGGEILDLDCLHQSISYLGMSKRAPALRYSLVSCVL